MATSVRMRGWRYLPVAAVLAAFSVTAGPISQAAAARSIPRPPGISLGPRRGNPPDRR